MNQNHVYDIDDDIIVRIDPGGGITIKAITAHGDPVELSASQARRLARALEEMAEEDDA